MASSASIPGTNIGMSVAPGSSFSYGSTTKAPATPAAPSAPAGKTVSNVQTSPDGKNSITTYSDGTTSFQGPTSSGGQGAGVQVATNPNTGAASPAPTVITNAGVSGTIGKNTSTLNTAKTGTGIVTGANGPQYANGTLVDKGGYAGTGEYGDFNGVTYLPPSPGNPYGSAVPTPTTTPGALATPVTQPAPPISSPTTSTSTTSTVPLLADDPVHQQIMDQLAAINARGDARLVSTMQNIQSSYAQLESQQADINRSETAGLTALLFKGGSMQTASATGAIQAMMTKGLQAIQTLEAQKGDALNKAQQAQDDQDYKFVQVQLAEYDKANQQSIDQQDKLTAAIVAANNTANARADATRAYNLDVQKYNDTHDQQAFDNAFKVEQEKFNQQNKNDTLALDRFKAGMGAGANNGVGNGITSTQMSPTGGVDPVSQKQTYDQIAQTYGPMTAVAIQGLVDYSRLPTDWRPGATKGMTRDQAVTLAQMLDPTYTEAGAPARQAYMKGLASTAQNSIGGQINAANTGIAHLASYADTMSKIPKSVSSTLNWFDNALTLNQGVKQNLAQAKTEGEGVGTEFAKFLSSSAPDVASLNEQKANLGVNSSNAQVRGATQGMLNLLSGRLQTLSDQYQQTMGRAQPTTFLNPQSIAKLSNLKNQGYTVDIKGVYYSDPKKYASIAPENAAKLNEVRTAHPELSPSQATQLAQYLQENGQ